MDLLAKIRRWHFREKVKIREIARRTGLSKNTVKKYLRDETVEPAYPERENATKLDPYREDLASWLKAESGKGRRERRTLRAIYKTLKGLGYGGDYSRLTAFARRWRQEQSEIGKGVYVPLTFAPGEALQFDWSIEYAELAGVVVKLKVAQITLCYSRMALRVAYFSEAHEMLFDAHWRGLAFFGGVPARAIYDNMKTAVTGVGIGKVRTVNPRFTAMMSHYLLEPDFCNRAAGWEKGRVEKKVQDGRKRLFVPRPSFANLEALNAWLKEQCLVIAQETRHRDFPDRTVAEVYAEEKPRLLPLPPAFDGFIEHPVRVSPTCLVTFERNRYSVHAAHANRWASLRAYADRVVVVSDGHVVAEHPRYFGRGQTAYDWRHYLPVLERKPGALRNGAPFDEMPEPLLHLQHVLLKRMGGDREMADILAQVPVHGLEAVIVAVELALEGKNPSREHVFNLLGRLKEASAPAAVETPDALSLDEEPVANVSRYDTLRIVIPLASLLPVAIDAVLEVRHAA